MITALQDPILVRQAKSGGFAPPEAPDISFESFLAWEDRPPGPLCPTSDYSGPSPENEMAASADAGTPFGGRDHEVSVDAQPAPAATGPFAPASDLLGTELSVVHGKDQPVSGAGKQTNSPGFPADPVEPARMREGVPRRHAERATQEPSVNANAPGEDEVGEVSTHPPLRSSVRQYQVSLDPRTTPEASSSVEDGVSKIRENQPENPPDLAEDADVQVDPGSSPQFPAPVENIVFSPQPAPPRGADEAAGQILGTADRKGPSVPVSARGSIMAGPSPRASDVPAAPDSAVTGTLNTNESAEMDGSLLRRRSSAHRSTASLAESPFRPEVGDAAPAGPARAAERSEAQPARPMGTTSARFDDSGAMPVATPSHATAPASLPTSFSHSPTGAAELAATPSAERDRQPQPALESGPDLVPEHVPTLAGLQVHYGPGGPGSFGVDRAAPHASGSRRGRIEPGQVARQIAHAVGKSHADQIEIILHPEELGKVRMVMTPGDNPSVTIQADNADTLELLRRNVDQLARELRESGFGEASLSFSDGADRRAPSRPALMQADSGSGTDLPEPLRADPKPASGQPRDPRRQLDIRI